MLVLGVDPGLNITGYGLIKVQGKNFSLVTAGFIETSAKFLIQKRLSRIYVELSSLVKKYQPAVMALEKLYSHYRHPTTACLLGHVRGVICLLSAQENIPLFEYGATRIKKAILGKGHASKDQIQRMVQKLLTLNDAPMREDISDALALAIAHTYISRVKI